MWHWLHNFRWWAPRRSVAAPRPPTRNGALYGRPSVAPPPPGGLTWRQIRQAREAREARRG